MVAYDYSDESWLISDLGKEELKRDLHSSLDPKTHDRYELSLDLKTVFTRKLPLDAPIASII